MLSVNYADCHKQAHCAECHYAKCRYAECRSAIFLSILLTLQQNKLECLSQAREARRLSLAWCNAYPPRLLGLSEETP